MAAGLWNGCLNFTSQIETLSSPQHAHLPTVSKYLQEIKRRPNKSPGVAFTSKGRKQLYSLAKHEWPWLGNTDLGCLQRHDSKDKTMVSWSFHSKYKTKSKAGHLPNTLVKTPRGQGIAKLGNICPSVGYYLVTVLALELVDESGLPS